MNLSVSESEIQEYVNKYPTFDKYIVFEHNICQGGIGDRINHFMYTLQLCIKYNYRFYYLVNNIPIEKYLKLKYPQMYITHNELIQPVYLKNSNDIINIEANRHYCIQPFILYYKFSVSDHIISPRHIFYFPDEVIEHSKRLLSPEIINYNTIHLRLGDKFLEVNKSYIQCVNDTRHYNEDNIFKCIEENSEKNIIFFSDNMEYKHKIKNKFNNVIVLDTEVVHCGHINTTDKQVLDVVTEFYLIINSDKIYAASFSGFTILASYFKNIPLINLY